MNQSNECLEEILSVLKGPSSQEKAPSYFFCFGNHEFYNFERRELVEKLVPKSATPTNNDNGLYYDFSPYPGFRFVCVDSYDISLLGPSSEENKKIAQDLLAQNNPNDLSISGTWFNNLPREKYRWVPYNGGV